MVFSGGSSVGERDLIIDVIGGLGEVIFHGIAVKPGKPTAFGRIGRRPVFGMPGYATSCLSNALHAARPDAAPHRAIAGIPAARPCACRSPGASCRRPAGTSSIPCGSRTARAVPAFKASGDITSMAQADGYIEIPAQTDIVEAGEMVDVKLF